MGGFSKRIRAVELLLMLFVVVVDDDDDDVVFDERSKLRRLN